MDYHAISTKIKAMKAKLLSREEYKALCQCHTVEHFFGQGISIRDRMSITEELKRLRSFIKDPEGRRILLFEGQMKGQTKGQSEGQMKDKDMVKVWSFVKSLPYGQNRQALTYIKGVEIDLNNILYIYRLKRYYTKAQVYPHLVPICYKLNKGDIKKMVECPGTPEFIVAVLNTPYRHINFENAEKAIVREMDQVNSKMAKRFPKSMAEVLGYLSIRRKEMHNLTAIMEGIKYQLRPEEIFKHLL